MTNINNDNRINDRPLPRMRSIPWILHNLPEIGLGERFLREIVRNGEVRAVKTGNKYLVNIDSLIDYLNGGDGE